MQFLIQRETVEYYKLRLRKHRAGLSSRWVIVGALELQD